VENINNLIAAEYYVNGDNVTSYHLYIITKSGKVSIGLIDSSSYGEISLQSRNVQAYIHHIDLGGFSI